MKLGIGTVQFGLDYGITNRDGKTPPEEAARILTAASGLGVRVLDTAALYGDSEAVLGGILDEGHPFDVVTKTCKLSGGSSGNDSTRLLLDTFRRSLELLKQHSVYGLLLHSAADLLAEGGEMLFDTLLDLKVSGEVAKVGVSVYSPEEVERVLERFPVDLIQVPVNVLDQRLIKGGHLAELKKRGVEIHARSPFLQGILLMNPEELSDYFNPVRPLLRNYHSLLKERGVTPVQAALGFVHGVKELDIILCGFNNRAQLLEACSGLQEVETDLFSPFAVDLAGMVEPSRWPAEAQRR